MGIGTLWKHNDLIDSITGAYHSDTHACEVFSTLSNSQADIPLDEGFGHWHEDVFNNELITPISEFSGISEPLSELTLASLEDIGWNVFNGVAEAFPNSDTFV